MEKQKEKEKKGGEGGGERKQGSVFQMPLCQTKQGEKRWSETVMK